MALDHDRPAFHDHRCRSPLDDNRATFHDDGRRGVPVLDNNRPMPLYHNRPRGPLLDHRDVPLAVIAPYGRQAGQTKH